MADSKAMHPLVQKCLGVARLHRRCVDETVASVGMHRSLHLMLLQVARSDGKDCQAVFARRLGISTAAAAVSLRKLEDEGYITRVMDENDKRRNGTVLTEKAKKVLDASCDSYIRIDEAMFRGISEADLAVLGRCLDKMKENLLALRGEEEGEEVGPT